MVGLVVASLTKSSTTSVESTDGQESSEGEAIPLSLDLIEALNVFDEVMMDVSLVLNEDILHIARLK